MGDLCEKMLKILREYKGVDDFILGYKKAQEKKGLSGERPLAEGRNVKETNKGFMDL